MTSQQGWCLINRDRSNDAMESQDGAHEGVRLECRQ